MTTFNLYRLTFSSPLHISDAREDYGSSEKLLHSDSMYAALIASLAKVGALHGIAETGDLGCTISSLFPYTKAANQFVYFFPKPFLPFNDEGKDMSSFSKKLKKVKWIDKNYFEKVINNTPAKIENDATMLKGSYMTDAAIDPQFSYSQTVPRISVPRSAEENKGDTKIFYMERMYFNSDSGLYFLASGDTKNLESALNVLQYEGIGTDRTVGQGFFSFEKDKMELSCPVSATHSCSLSLFCPEQKSSLQSMIDDQSRWEIIKRGGWISTDAMLGIRKKSVYMFTEGSVFKTSNQTEGKVNLNLTPTAEGLKVDHKIWRSGRSIFLPVIA